MAFTQDNTVHFMKFNFLSTSDSIPFHIVPPSKCCVETEQRERGPVVDLDVGVSHGVVLEPHELKVQDWREAEEDHALPGLLQGGVGSGE